MTLCLTVRQPWAWAIIHAGKDVENRKWPTSHTGLIGIHAGKVLDRQGPGRLSKMGIELPDDLVTGAIIGTVELVECIVDPRRSRWAERRGYYQWVLANPRAIEPIPWAGEPALWNGPDLDGL